LTRDPRRYLKLQRELGGGEVILSRPLAELRGSRGGPLPDPPAPPARPADRIDESAPPTARPAASSKATDAKSSQPADWRKNAPPIPAEPGLVVLAAERGLMDAPPSWESLSDVARTVAECRKCFLCEGRSRTVPGEGSAEARLMFVGEGPGQTEDETGRPFVGRAGELLTQIIEAIELRREDVFIANAVKCRPPQNRKPLPDELAACWPYLERQIELIRPKVLVALGATAAAAMLRVNRALAELRGKVHSYRGIPLVVTYHPAALLRNPNWKKPTWDDVRIARQLLDR
jgi:uracil-DNA glycosylase family 4